MEIVESICACTEFVGVGRCAIVRSYTDTPTTVSQDPSFLAASREGTACVAQTHAKTGALVCACAAKKRDSSEFCITSWAYTPNLSSIIAFLTEYGRSTICASTGRRIQVDRDAVVIRQPSRSRRGVPSRRKRRTEKKLSITFASFGP